MNIPDPKFKVGDIVYSPDEERNKIQSVEIASISVYIPDRKCWKYKLAGWGGAYEDSIFASKQEVIDIFQGEIDKLKEEISEVPA